ncbi:MAG TPA: SMP-30/gluconolactonase/LRE family protein [Nitrospirales bacterium]|nr:gluconolactonase [Nitrospiraceae bacterium]HNP30223.1 SMP-30/gluconolactonase/LRE family protein [Nitrospirales bacterium]
MKGKSKELVFVVVGLTALWNFWNPASALSVASPGNPGSPTVHRIKLDPRFDQLISPDSVVERLAEGFTWVEGPLWNANDQMLLFSDIPANSVFAWKAGKGISLFLHPSGYLGNTPFTGKESGSNGLTWDSTGRLVLCQHGDRRIVRLEQDGQFTILADRYQGRRLNSPNDLVYRPNGDLYFTDPPFGLPKQFHDPSKELPFQGVYRLTPQGRLDLLIQDVIAPNGLAFSPDATKLYVTDVNPKRPAWLVYDVLSDGTMTNGRVFADATPWRKDPYFGPDGVKVDRDGNVWGARPGGINIFASDGILLGMIETGMPTSNLNWGEDGSVLFITGGSAIYRLKTLTGGETLPPASQ